MYLEHFGLDGSPFKITPVTDFFFPGANRGEEFLTALAKREREDWIAGAVAAYG